MQDTGVITLNKKGSLAMSARAKQKVVEESRPLNRVNSTLVDMTTRPKTLGERMTRRRLELQLTQAQVAEEVVFSPKSGGRQDEERNLSRNAYCMYEKGAVEPDLSKIEAIAKALRTTPQWLAFGVAEKKQVDDRVSLMTFDSSKKSFVKNGVFHLDRKWLDEKYEIAPSDVTLVLVTDTMAGLRPADIAILNNDTSVSARGDVYVYTLKNKMSIGFISMVPGKSDRYRVFDEAKSSHKEMDASNVEILGRLLGKIGDISHE